MSKIKNKKKKRYSAASQEEYNAAKAEVKKSLKRFRWRLALLMLGGFILLCAVYYILLAMHVLWATPVLYTTAAVLFILFFIINRGFSRENVSRETLPDAWNEEQKDRFMEKEEIRRMFARRLMIVMVPVLLLVALDMIILVVLPMFRISGT